MFPKSFKKLIDHFSTLPSVGPKMAERLVLYLFKQDSDKLLDFSKSLGELKTNIRYCQKCFNLSEQELCQICLDSKRDSKTICVVEEPLDIIALERTRKFSGHYHVLGGVLSPMKNVDQNLKIKELENRITREKPLEIILAMNPTTEGDATTLYLKRLLKDHAVKITTLGRGLSSGSDLEYADEMTLSSALLNRKEML